MRTALATICLLLPAGLGAGGEGRVMGAPRRPEPRPADVGPLFALLDAPPPVAAAMPASHRMRCLVTAYTPYDPEDELTGWTGRTSLGISTTAEPWGVAADPRALPYGALVRVPGYAPTVTRPAGAWWPVDDTGGRLRRSWRQAGVVHLDLRFRTRRAALAWGTRWVDVDVILP